MVRYSIPHSRRGYNEASPVWRYARGAYAINISHRVYFINHGFLAPSWDEIFLRRRRTGQFAGLKPMRT
jgi:hypothetical protein